MPGEGETTSLHRMAMDFNNFGVTQHECGDLLAAAEMYKDGMQAMKEFVGNDDATEAERRQLFSKWKAKFDVQDRLKQQGETRKSGVDACEPRQTADDEDAQLFRPIRMDSADDYTEDSEAITVVLLHNIALTRYQQGHLNLAIGLLQMALTLAPETAHALALGSIHFILGSIYLQQGKEDESMQEFMSVFKVKLESTTESNNFRAKVLNRIGRILVSRGNLGDALEVFHGAILVYSQNNEDDKTETDDEANSSAPAA